MSICVLRVINIRECERDSRDLDRAAIFSHISLVGDAILIAKDVRRRDKLLQSRIFILKIGVN